MVTQIAYVNLRMVFNWTSSYVIPNGLTTNAYSVNTILTSNSVLVLGLHGWHIQQLDVFLYLQNKLLRPIWGQKSMLEVLHFVETHIQDLVKVMRKWKRKTDLVSANSQGKNDKLCIE